MISGAWAQITALAAAFVIAAVTTPAGVSGAVLLLPFQVSVLGTPRPAVTPTNLLYNVVATPGAIWRAVPTAECNRCWRASNALPTRCACGQMIL